MSIGSLRLRLLAGAAAFVLAALVLAAFGLTLLFERHVTRWIDAQMTTHLDQLIAGIEKGADGKLAVVKPPSDARFEQRFVGATTVEDRPRGLLAARYLVLDTTSATGYRVEPAEVIDGIVGSLKELPAHMLEVRFDDLAYPSYYDFDVPHLRTASVVLGRAELDEPPADARLRWQSTLTSAWDATDGMKLVACGVWAESNLVDLPPVVGSIKP